MCVCMHAYIPFPPSPLSASVSPLLSLSSTRDHRQVGVRHFQIFCISSTILDEKEVLQMLATVHSKKGFVISTMRYVI